jgi:lactococcin 972 family bacteriocin
MKLKRILISAAGAAALGVALAAPAMAEQVGGGTWYHGTTGALGGGTVYSEYHHGSNCHTASVRNAHGATDWDSAGAGSWAMASTSAVPLQTDYSYWNNRC